MKFRGFVFAGFLGVIVMTISCDEGSDLEVRAEGNTEQPELSEEADARRTVSLSGVGQTPPVPPKPKNIYDVASITSKADNYTRPFIPPYRLSTDGRIALNLKRVAGNHLGFNLLKPEAIAKNPIDLGRGAVMLGHTNSNYNVGVYRQDLTQFHNDSGGYSGHSTLCDPNPDNPQVSGQRDRYDLVVFSSYIKRNEHKMRFWATPIKVFVTNPKKPSAYISTIRVGDPKPGPVLLLKEFFEPMMSSDGKLIVGRAAKSDFSPYGFNGTYDISYMMAPENSDPCDVTKFSQPKPIANLPHDVGAKNRYPIAAYPFLDTQRNPIPKDADISGTYPWMDHKARNLFFYTDRSTLAYRDGEVVKMRFPTRCLSGVRCEAKPTDLSTFEGSDATRGLSLMGAWTHGKAVTLDGAINYTDFGVRADPKLQREVKLYGSNTWVRVAAGRANSDTMAKLPAPVVNATFVDSLENRFNFHSHMQPRTPRDVVWTMSKGSITQEIVFDDYMDTNMMIFSTMNASWLQEAERRNNVTNGFENLSNGKGFTHGLNGKWSIQLANAATTPFHDEPKKGIVEGPARVEPVALGGIHGKGLYVGGDTKVRYWLPSSSANRAWYVAAFIDNRAGASDSKFRQLFKFPNGTQFQLRTNKGRLRIVINGKVLRALDVPLSTRNVWRHIAFRYVRGQNIIETYLNGMLIDRWKHAAQDKSRFELSSGNLELAGRDNSGVIGWLDDFKLHLAPWLLNPEHLCNHARGTIVGLNQRSDSAFLWDAAAKASDEWSEAIESFLSKKYRRYGCHISYNNEKGATHKSSPGSSVSLRDQINFPEGPLRVNQPRPDSTKNMFCLTCHTNSNSGTGANVNRPTELKVPALSSIPNLLLRQDTRRSPAMGVRRVFGHVPANMVTGTDGVSRPSTSREFETGGYSDYWAFP